jgi:hypothetical protein
MRVLVVYESMFGNTEQVARAVADGLAGALGIPASVHTAAVGAVADLTWVDVLVVGGPTHAFGMSRPESRRSAAGQGARGATVDLGLREWLARFDRLEVAAAAFDTRVGVRRLPGSAARGAHRLLRGLGCRMIAPAESFLVTGGRGPLKAGELERARRWGAQLAASVAVPVAVPAYSG